MFLVSGFVSWRYIWGASVYVYDGLLAIGAEEQFLLLQVLDGMKHLESPLSFWTHELDCGTSRCPTSRERCCSSSCALVSETGRGRQSVLQHVSWLNDFSFSTKTVNRPEMCLSSHEILLSSHSFLSMKCDSRNQNLLSSFVAWRGIFFSLARSVCQDWPAW